MKQEFIKTLHPGLIAASYNDAKIYMPEIINIIDQCPTDCHIDDYLIDVKVHMLMPNEWPCIPDWHTDSVPRDENKKKLWGLVKPDNYMYLLVSGPPITEFQDGRKVKPMEWIKFNQLDFHRGNMSDKHQWRVFMRITPKEIDPRRRHGEACLRRHSQVYLNSNNFEW